MGAGRAVTRSKHPTADSYSGQVFFPSASARGWLRGRWAAEAEAWEKGSAAAGAAAAAKRRLASSMYTVARRPREAACDACDACEVRVGDMVWVSVCMCRVWAKACVVTAGRRLRRGAGAP